MAVAIKIKWGKETLPLEIEASEPLKTLKQKIQELTRVPVEKQKLIGLKPGGADVPLSSLGLTTGKQLLLIGAPEGTVIPEVISSADKAGPNGGGGGEEKNAVMELNGLINMGNTCYLNSAIQLLRSIPELKYFLKEYHSDNKLLTAMGRVLQQLSQTVTEPVIPGQLVAEFQQKFPQFREVDESNRLMQQDSHEALNALLQEISSSLPNELQYLFSGELRRSMSTVISSSPSQRNADSSPFSQAPANESEPSGTSTSNADEQENLQPFTIISCNIAGEVQTLEASLERAFNEEVTTVNERTQQEEKRTFSNRITKAPEYLLIHLVRFSWRSDINKKTKMLKSISFPSTLDIHRLSAPELKALQSPVRQTIKDRLDAEMEKRKRLRHNTTEENCVSTEAESPIEAVPSPLHNESGFYELCGVISHKGRHADGGHYVYWGKRGGKWVVHDDENGGVVSEEDVLRLRGIGEAHIAYVLLYRSRDPLTKKAAASY